MAAVTTLWPVECFLWSMGVHKLDICITLLLINFVHWTNPPQQIVHARDVRRWCNVPNINSSWNFEVLATNESSSLHSLCSICDAECGMKWWLLLVLDTVLPSSNLLSIFSLTSTMSAMSIPKKIIDFISSWHTFSISR